MYPERLAAPMLADGSFVRVSDAHLDVPLFWQCWKLDSPMVKRITEAVRSAAAQVVRAVAAVLETLSPDLHDDLSPCPPRLDVGQSFRDRFEWEGPINNGLYSTRIDEKT